MSETDGNARSAAKAALEPLRAALYDFEPSAARAAIAAAFAPDARVRLAFPFEDLPGPDGLFERALAPLHRAFPELERRETIFMAGPDDAGELWVGACGFYAGTFAEPFLDIPPTGRFAAFRFHEFFRVEENRVTEFQGLWDLPELMMQARAWPMGPSLGREWAAPAPASGDGVGVFVRDDAHSKSSLERVKLMVDGLSRFADGGHAAMRLGDHFHPRLSWYGPSGVGVCRGIEGFRAHHQIPFLSALPDRTDHIGRADSDRDGAGHLFAEGDYVAFTAWPGMQATVSGDGWLGIAPSGQKITMRSLDFWRVENDLIRENWVLVDLLSVFDQLGVDVFRRMRELTRPA